MNTDSLLPSPSAPASNAERRVPRPPVSQAEAADAMWIYYRDNKLSLMPDTKEHREQILAQLKAGVSIEEVFAPYRKSLR